MMKQEYIADIKTRFGDQTTKSGELIRDMNDDVLFEKMMERYPGDRSKITEDVEVETSLPETPQQSQLQQRFNNVAQKAQERLGRMAQNTFQSDERLSSRLLQNAGEVAGLAGDVAFEGIKALTPDRLKEDIKTDVVQPVASFLSENETAQGIGGAVGEAWDSLDPEMQQNFEAVGNIAGAVPVGKGAQVAVKTGQQALKAGEEAVEGGVRAATQELEKQAVKKGVKDAERAYEDALEITAPVMGKKDSIAAFKRAGEPGGVVSEGKLKTYEVAPDVRAKEIADDVYGIVSSKQGPIENIGSVNNRIKEIAETEVRPFLQESGIVYNPMQLQTYLKQLPKPLSLKANPETFRAYNAVLNSAMEITNRFPRTSEGLWDARKAIDDMIEKEFGDAAFDSPSGVGARRAALSIRSGINDFISEGLGGGDLDLVNRVNDFIREARKRGIEITDPSQVKKQAAQISGIADVPDEELLKAFWKAKLREMNNLYIAQENMAEKAYKLLGKNFIERWMKENPGKASLIGKVLGGAGVITIGGATLGAVSD